MSVHCITEEKITTDRENSTGIYSVRCSICENRCTITEGATGRCRMYTVSDGLLKEKYPGMLFAMYPVSIENIPILHFMPNGKLMLISTIGCNFSCPGCVSWMIIKSPDSVSRMLKKVSPEEVVKSAKSEDCSGIVFCLNEPSVSYYSFLEYIRAAKENGLVAGCSTNGYMTKEAVVECSKYLDFVNIGLKGSSPERYRECKAASPDSVFRNIRLFHENGVHVEVSIMHLLGREEEVLKAAEIIGGISREIPLQIMPFMPHDESQRKDRPSVAESEKLCTSLEQYLDFVYIFNTPETERLNTYCPSCKRIIIKRKFNGPMGAKVISYREGGVCECGRDIGIKGEIKPHGFSEPRYIGGYRSVKALDGIAVHLKTLGVTDSSTVIDVWIKALESGYLSELHKKTSTVEGFFNDLGYFASLVGAEEKYREIYRKYHPVVEKISKAVAGAETPPVYSIMAKPVLPLFVDKMDIDLIRIAGGYPINLELGLDDKSTEMEIDPEVINSFRPEFVFVSGKRDGRGLTPGDWREAGFDIPAVEKGNVFSFFYPGSDSIFGWTITLMDLANRIHPEIFSFDLERERKLLAI
ncbi:pyruvate-formate lyase-activating enzyme [Methanomicrobium sp. W14]|uniref:radical SAM protein n=1 Tax=Methanomicrobium sp. W14 TaxID=2817839 RepID=UPI001AEA2B96|nr:radical SAM protein [Methanomicrobium sp. W14]MBP2132607.1 pyruvate-formate lyase-activating enzyme [Methanomicrobium sp. W14]